MRKNYFGMVMNTLRASISFSQNLKKKCIKFKIESCFHAIGEEQNVMNVMAPDFGKRQSMLE